MGNETGKSDKKDKYVISFIHSHTLTRAHTHKQFLYCRIFYAFSTKLFAKKPTEKYEKYPRKKHGENHRKEPWSTIYIVFHEKKHGRKKPRKKSMEKHMENTHGTNARK